MPWMSFVTVDIDGKEAGWRLRAVRAYYNLRHVADEVDVAISSSHKGLHIVGWFDTLLSDEAEDRLREALGDDQNRVRMDEVRGGAGHPTQVRWTEKGQRDGVAIKEYDDIWTALDHMEMENRSDYRRIHGVANRGHKSITEMSTPLRLERASGL